MRGYLIDTQTVSFWFGTNTPQHANVLARVNALPGDAPLRVSVVTMGEIEFGHAITSNPDPKVQAEFKQFLKDRFPAPLPITEFTPAYYGEIRSLLFKKYPPPREEAATAGAMLRPSYGT